MLCHVALVRTDVSEERIASVFRMTRNSALRTLAAIARSTLVRSMLYLLVTANVVPFSPILVTLMIEALCSSVT
jgi:hypothetical protein